MKPFAFRLERVLEWRRTQLCLEEGKIADLACRLQKLEEQVAALAREAKRTQDGIRRSACITALDFQAAVAYCDRLRRDEKKSADLVCFAERAIADQRQRVVAARRRVRLLERLRDQRRSEWDFEMQAELEAMSADSALGRWSRDI